MTEYAPAVRDLSAATNADFNEYCSLQTDAGSPIDLTGAVLAMQVRSEPGGTIYLDLDSTGLTANGSGLVVGNDSTQGGFTIVIKKADLAGIAFGDLSALAASYDVTLTQSETSVLAKGTFFISKGVTA